MSEYTPEALAQCFAGEHALVMLPGSMDLYTAEAAAHYFGEAWQDQVASLLAENEQQRNEVARLRGRRLEGERLIDKVLSLWEDRGFPVQMGPLHTAWNEALERLGAHWAVEAEIGPPSPQERSHE